MTRYMDLSPDNNVFKQSEEKCVNKLLFKKVNNKNPTKSFATEYSQVNF